MKKLNLMLLAFTLIVATACKNDKKDKDVEEEVEVEVEEVVETSTPKSVEILLEPKSESAVSGVVVFTEANGEVSMTARLSGLSPGDHAIHIHEKADCSSADGTSSGGHWNPTSQPHGKWGAESGYHKGDIGNFTADAEGNAEVKMNTSEWCLGCGDTNKDVMGKAVIVHQGTDDFTSQPSGAAGSRISCGGIIE